VSPDEASATPPAEAIEVAGRVGLARRTAAALAWNVGASPLQMAVVFGRSVLLARLLPVAIFGTFTFATSIVFVSSLLAGFGMGYAYLNRVAETQDETVAADVFFTLKLGATACWAAVLGVGAMLLADGDLRVMLLGLTFTQSGTLLVDTPRLVLTRRVQHRRLVVVDTLALVAASAVAVTLAWRGQTVWVFLGSELTVLAVTAGSLLMWRPVWRPHLRWDRDIAAYYLRFARASLPTSLLMRGIENLDNLWTGTALGDYALGIYSRAYRFALYPRTLVALPASKVVRGTFAELKSDREGLSRALVGVNAGLVRSGALLAGALVLAAPELVRIVLGEKWLPMVLPFQLLVAFMLLDPIRLTLTDLLLGIGEQGVVLRSYVLQFVVLGVGLVALGNAFGVAGVAMAVNLMAAFATVHLSWLGRRHADFSPWVMWAPPLASMLLAVTATVAVTRLVPSSEWPWSGLLIKSGTYVAVYALALAVLERRRLEAYLRRAKGAVR
jgi:O-antigen/teichoic acid export membrane protein